MREEGYAHFVVYRVILSVGFLVLDCDVEVPVIACVGRAGDATFNPVAFIHGHRVGGVEDGLSGGGPV